MFFAAAAAVAVDAAAVVVQEISEFPREKFLCQVLQSFWDLLSCSYVTFLAP